MAASGERRYDSRHMKLDTPLARSFAQLAALAAALCFFQNVWPAAPYGGRANLVMGYTPYLAWIPLFLVYACWPGTRHVGLCVAGNVGLLASHQGALALLGHWHHQQFLAAAAQCHRVGGYGGACPASEPIGEPPPPPPHWEWAAAGYFAAVLALYVILALIDRRRRAKKAEAVPCE